VPWWQFVPACPNWGFLRHKIDWLAEKICIQFLSYLNNWQFFNTYMACLLLFCKYLHCRRPYLAAGTIIHSNETEC